MWYVIIGIGGFILGVIFCAWMIVNGFEQIRKK